MTATNNWIDRDAFRHVAEQLVSIVEGFGAAVIVLGGIAATTFFFVRVARRRDFHETYRTYRDELGRAIVLGLEVLVAADIVQTIIVDPSLESLLILALVVLVRTFLSFTLTAEIEGMWPWQRARFEKLSQVAPNRQVAPTRLPPSHPAGVDSSSHAP